MVEMGQPESEPIRRLEQSSEEVLRQMQEFVSQRAAKAEEARTLVLTVLREYDKRLASAIRRIKKEMLNWCFVTFTVSYGLYIVLMSVSATLPQIRHFAIGFSIPFLIVGIFARYREYRRQLAIFSRMKPDEL